MAFEGDTSKPVVAMEQAKHASNAIDFDLRRAARRRVVTLLEEHQQSEALAAKHTAESLLDFYEGALRSIGRWILCETDSPEESTHLHTFPEFASWTSTVSSLRQANEDLIGAQRALRDCEDAITRIEPNALKRPFSNKPGMKEAKMRRDSASTQVLLRKVAADRVTEELRSTTRRLLAAVAAKIEELPSEIRCRREVDQLMSEHFEAARTRWLSHRDRENAGLVEVVKLTRVLTDATGASHDN